VRLELGSPVRCADAPFGELADVVIDPISRRVTHLVVQPEHRHEAARLVSIDRAQSTAEGITLDYSADELERLEPLQESAFLRLGEFPVADPDWEVGIQNMLALPVYPGVDGMTVSIDPDTRVPWSYDRIPKGEIELRRSSAVSSADGHHLGHIDGFVVEDEVITAVVLERGHRWGRREVVIPYRAVERAESDSIVLSLTKDEVGALEARPVHRWF
jgi:sporulation protein YlmC with PRC-barrel domain